MSRTYRNNSSIKDAQNGNQPSNISVLSVLLQHPGKGSREEQHMRSPNLKLTINNEAGAYNINDTRNG